MRKLHVKLLRDLWRVKGQALAIVHVIGAGIALLVMSRGMIASLDATMRAYNDRYRVADVYAPATRAPNRLMMMEKTQRAAVVPADLGWNDVGAWSALWDVGTRDEAGNVTVGDVITQDTRNAYLRTGDGMLLATVGLDNVVMVVTDDVVLAAAKDRAQDVKKIVDALKAKGRSKATSHTTVHRPWGSYRGVDSGPRFQVERITVKPGAKISLQKHARRAEHWVVVQGTARVIRGEDVLVLRENMSTYIPVGTVHRLENIGTDDLHLIEVQSGAYLGEDDIVRIEDSYGRS